MNLASIANLASRQALKVKKHSPVILFTAGVVGVVTTVVLASRATLKLEEVLEDAQANLDKVEILSGRNDMAEKYTAEDAHNDRVLIYVKTGVKIAQMYGPAILVGAASIAALTGSHVILTKRNGALMAAYAVLDKGFREYRKRVVDSLGVEKDREFRYGGELVETLEEGEDGKTHKKKRIEIPGNPSIYARCFDRTCNPWQKTPQYNQFFIQCQQNYANDKLRAVGHLFLNEVYEMLGMPHTREGALVCWLANGDGDGYVDFGVFEGDRYSAMRFVKGDEDAIWLDFNVDGIIYDKI